ncbi:hypothetical protein QET93_005705 [Akkermansia sp. N21116]|jgi:hypothetical protein|uniref:hypothetical protein n=1 Tax=Akkermansia sp. N21116 TaxID=3040764 RepID=UPI00244ED224|nr:hypothetical protein [Akkermansia sp. N21116]WPX41596.1 hypothetical protein QET93_005705 [Akkermansia sp. N21116]
MNKKVWISIAAVLLAAVAGWFLWLSPPEYGDNYSEQQRKLWNERRALLPWDWMDGNRIVFDPAYLQFMTGLDWKEVDQLRSQKEEQNEQLVSAQNVLRDQEKLIFQGNLPAQPDFTSLPVDLVPFWECLRRARNGDADACMAMAWRVGENSVLGIGVWSWREVRDVDYWLNKATDLGRPGALFLKHFFQMMQPESRKALSLDEYATSASRSATCPDYTGLPGYEEFEDCLRKGDLMAFRLMSFVSGTHDLPPGERALLMETLRNGVKAGDVAAMEKMAQLICTRETRRRRSDVWKEMQASFWYEMIQKLPRSMHLPLGKRVVQMGLINPADTVADREWREGLDCARVAARRGSLIGMDCWLANGLASVDYYTKEDWEEVFRFHRTLWESGYVPAFDRWESGKWSPTLDRNLLECYYEPESLNKVSSDFVKRYMSGEYWWIDGGEKKLTHAEDAEGIRRELEEKIAERGSDAVLRQMLRLYDSWKDSPDEVDAYVGKVKEWAAEGDPLGKLVLGFCYEHGTGVPCDLGKAWACYREAREIAVNYGGGFVSFKDSTNEGKSSTTCMPNAPAVFILFLGIHHKEFPGRDEHVLYELAQELEPFVDNSPYTGHLRYLLGRVYEEGIGTSVDHEKALKYYQCLVSGHLGCSEGAERLQREAKGNSGEK